MSASEPRLPLHPRNRGFRWSQPSGPFRRIHPEQARAYREEGFFVLEDAFDPETVRALTREIDPLEARTSEFLRTLPGGRMHIARADEITFSVHLVTRSPRLRELISGPVFCDLAHDLVGPDVRLYWDQAVYKKPGTASEFPWHQDNGYTYVEPQQYLTCWLALTDTDEERGCPWVAPGLHKLGTLRHEWTDLGWRCLEHPPRALAVPARAGSIVVFSSLTPHRTGPNRSAEVRKAYIVQLAPDGACTWRESGSGPAESEPCSAPDRQFPILVRGEPSRPAGLPPSGERATPSS
ncbi:MAG: phytanoyl-CoA dioxygenase family protein [Myxococcota bacterium]